jgi:hypothetical protein
MSSFRDTQKITDNEVVTTRFGRVSKPPIRYEPVEQVEDDYDPDDYDTDDSANISEEIETESDEEDDESDADENGDLDGFIVPDKNYDSESDTDGESTVSNKKPTRTPIKKRPTSSRK